MNGAPEERRRNLPRRRVLKGARIVFNDGRSVIDCQVRNQSSTGARLKLATVIGVPDQFELRIGDEAARQCRIIWRTGEEIGVEF